MVVNANTELRKLRPAELYNLGMILNPSDNWKKLMASVTKDGITGICPKFPGEYISIVEQAAQQEHKLAAAIFLEEWATMGKKRPTVGLLLDLLLETQLFRAADYLAQDILKVDPPKRPSTGPAAVVDMDEITELLLRQNLQPESSLNDSNFCLRTTNEIPLSQINYPSNVFTRTSEKISEGNEDGVIEIQFAESESIQVLDAVDKFHEGNSERIDCSKSSNEISDLMKFSENSSEKMDFLPSNLMKFSTGDEKINHYEETAAYIPNFSLLQTNSKNLENSANYAFARNPELTSSELPYCVAKYGATSAESSAVDEEQTNGHLNFLRELSSAELPVCINNRAENMSSKSRSDNFSLANNSSILSGETIEESSEIYGDSMAEFPSFVRAAEKNDEENKNIFRNYEEIDELNSSELPVTVVQFHKQ